MTTKTKILIGILVIGIVSIGGWWVWSNLPLPKQLNETMEGVFYQVPTDPSAFVTGFRTCDGSEYYVNPGVGAPNFSFLNKDGSLIKGTFGLVNPTIGGGLVKLHGYAPFTTKKVNNLIKNVDKIISISDSECLPSTGFLEKVVITTDKTEYKKGEIINIVVNNKLDKSILYYSGGNRFWEIEYLEDGKWKNPAYERGGGFQLTEENEGDTCYILLYERMPPYELRPDSTRSQEWNQRICPFGEEDPSKPTFVKYIGAGHYRLIFYYGFEISSEDPYKIKDKKTIYSNEFTIREKKEIACFQLNEQQCRNQPACVPLGGAITTYFPEGEVETFSFEECVNRVPEYKNCKEVVKMTQMRGGSQYPKECRCCCEEGPFCKERPYPEK